MAAHRSTRPLRTTVRLEDGRSRRPRFGLAERHGRKGYFSDPVIDPRFVEGVEGSEGKREQEAAEGGERGRKRVDCRSNGPRNSRLSRGSVPRECKPVPFKANCSAPRQRRLARLQLAKVSPRNAPRAEQFLNNEIHLVLFSSCFRVLPF